MSLTGIYLEDKSIFGAFPVPIAAYELDSINDEMLKDLDERAYMSMSGNQYLETTDKDILDQEMFTEVKKDVLNSINAYYNQCYIDANIDDTFETGLNITKSFVRKVNQFDGHVHNLVSYNSIFSGFIALTETASAPMTILNPYLEKYWWQLNENDWPSTFDFGVKKNTLVIYPSFMGNFIKSYVSEDENYSLKMLMFDTFIEGK